MRHILRRLLRHLKTQQMEKSRASKPGLSGGGGVGSQRNRKSRTVDGVVLVGSLDARQCSEGCVLQRSVVGTGGSRLLEVRRLLVSQGRLCGCLKGCGGHYGLPARRETKEDLCRY